MTLSEVLVNISMGDKISIHDADGKVVFDGYFSKLKESVPDEKRREIYDKEVHQIRAYENTIILLLD